MESEQEIKQILDHAISNGFLGYLSSVYEKSITKFDSNSILLVLKNILSLLPTEQVRFYLDASIRVLLLKNKTLAFIANNLAVVQVVQILIQCPRLETLPTLVMDAISEKISRGVYWDTLKKLFTLMPRVEPFRVAIVLQESLDFKKSLVHNSEDQQRQHNAEIASPSPDHRRDNLPSPRAPLAPPRLLLQTQGNLLPPGVVSEAPSRIEEHPVGESSVSNFNLYRPLSIENAQPFSRGFYRILCTEVMTPEHNRAIIQRTGGEFIEFIAVTTVENRFSGHRRKCCDSQY
ncbi:hypothetical protein KQX54_001898 [Cotesia glomerata]|uniref:Uncharacterized protein n=1 Tax=Cotesia glomerata TaxID=32391 RepID=A0AAV7IKS1_COTGL|nr:hypothetical protein KQX54_001898 [Cotesia glomerata]